MPRHGPKTLTMRLLLINPPGKTRLQRRYVASYYAPNFLIPPLELMGLGAIARQRPAWDTRLLDCMAEGIGLERTVARLRAMRPDMLVTMLGFEVCGDDLEILARLKQELPEMKIFVFGYLPTHVPEQVLKLGGVDGIFLNEPEETFTEVLGRLERGESAAGSPGLAWVEEGEIHVGEQAPRIEDLDALPWADHTLVRPEAYSESFMPRPTGVIMSARGCAFSCTYCVRTFGRDMRYRSAESLAAEVAALREQGFPHVRFLDDTLTIKRDRMVELCARLSRQDRGLTWTALTRLDRVDADLLARMRRAGCRRLYVGVESASPRVLDLYKKRLSLEEIREKIPMVKAAGIEVCTYFIVGAPSETPEEIEASISLALELEPDYIIVTRIQYWPGTDLFAAHRDKLDFNLYPTSCEPIPGHGIMTHGEYMEWERKFYRRFYMRPRYVVRRVGTLMRTPADVLEGLGRLGAFVLNRGKERDFI